ncbi:MAG: hypothetical protein WBV74_07485 [Pseudonocardiaceae bacterium]
MRIDEAAEAIRDRPILNRGGVLIDHRCPRAAAATTQLVSR